MRLKDFLIITVVSLIILATVGGYIILSAQTSASDLAWAQAHRDIGRSNNRLGAVRHLLTQTHHPDFSDIHNFLDVINKRTDDIHEMEDEGRTFNGLLKLHQSTIVDYISESVITLNRAFAEYETQLKATISTYQNAVSSIENSRDGLRLRGSRNESMQMDRLLHEVIDLNNFSENNLKSNENKALIATVESFIETNAFLQSPAGATSYQSVQALISNLAILEEKTQTVSKIESVLSGQSLELFSTIDQARVKALSQNKLVFILIIVQLSLLASVFIYKALHLKRALVLQNLVLEDRVTERTKRLETALADLKLITKQQTKTEEQLRKALRAAEKAGEAKSSFLANMSHEIRTPMNGVLAMLELVSRKETNPEKQDQLQIAHNSARSLLNVLDDVLDYSRLEAGQFTIVSEPYDLRTIIEEVAGLFRSKATNKNVSILTTFENDLPKTIVGDQARVRQIVSNFVSNALKFTEKGSVEVQVRREHAQPDEQIRIEIVDTGIGISKEALSKLFQRFSQVDTSSTRQYGGTGLGLVLCKQLAELMSGSVGVESIEGQGSRFWTVLPIGNGDFDSVSTAASSQNEIPETLPFKSPNYNLRILAAEDNLVNQKVLQAMVQSIGYTVTMVANGQEVLDKLDSQPFDLILMDVQMPILDGVGATKAIRNLSGPMKDITIVALTANAMKGDRENYIAAGMDDYLPKPIELNKLAEMLDRISLTAGAADSKLSEQSTPNTHKQLSLEA